MSEHDAAAEMQVAKLRQMNVETEKFVAEQRKLIAEAEKPGRETRWFPWLQLLTSLIAAIAAVVAAVAVLMLHRP